MTLLTKPEAEQPVEQAGSMARLTATAKDVQAVLAVDKAAIILLVKKSCRRHCVLCRDESIKKFANAEQATSMNFASAKLTVDSSRSGWRMPSLSLV
jgi:hypothetical protein